MRATQARRSWLTVPFGNQTSNLSPTATRGVTSEGAPHDDVVVGVTVEEPARSLASRSPRTHIAQRRSSSPFLSWLCVKRLTWTTFWQDEHRSVPSEVSVMLASSIVLLLFDLMLGGSRRELIESVSLCSFTRSSLRSDDKKPSLGRSSRQQSVVQPAWRARRS